MKAQKPVSRRRRYAFTLKHDPSTGPLDMPTLYGLAAAMQQAAIQRYETLIPIMQQRGEVATAAAFRSLAEQAAEHLAEINKQAVAIGVALSEHDNETVANQLPPEIASTWEELTGSALLTPYRAFATAVQNKEQAATFFTYLAADAIDDTVRTEAEALAANQLIQASALRRWRRLAWHRERNRYTPAEPPRVQSTEQLQEFLDAARLRIHTHLSAIASRLQSLHDTDSAAFIGALALDLPLPAQSTVGDAALALQIQEDIAASTHTTALLVQAQRVLETLAEQLEAIAAQAQGATFDATIIAIDHTVSLLARIALRAANVEMS